MSSFHIWFLEQILREKTIFIQNCECVKKQMFLNYPFTKYLTKHMIFFFKAEDCLFHGVIVTEIVSSSFHSFIPVFGNGCYP